MTKILIIYVNIIRGESMQLEVREKDEKKREILSVFSPFSADGRRGRKKRSGGKMFAGDGR